MRPRKFENILKEYLILVLLLIAGVLFTIPMLIIYTILGMLGLLRRLCACIDRLRGLPPV